MAKESFNGIDLWDVQRSYRYEQGFTFELQPVGRVRPAREEFAARSAANTVHQETEQEQEG